MRAFKIIGKAAVAFYEELFFYFLTGIPHAILWILVIPGPFALTGIYVVGQRAVRGFGVKWGMIWEGIKEFGLRAFLLFLIIAAGYGLIAMNLWFYTNPEASPFPPSVAVWIAPIWIVLGLVWSGVTFYAQSFLMELKDPRMGLVLRNSLFLTILHPIQTLILLLVSVLVVAVSILLPVLVIVAPGFLSVLSLTAVRTLVAGLVERVEAMEEGEKEEEEAASDRKVEPEAEDMRQRTRLFEEDVEDVELPSPPWESEPKRGEEDNT